MATPDEPKALKEGYSPSKASFARFLVRKLVMKDIEKIPLSKFPAEIIQPPQDGLLPTRSTEPTKHSPERIKIGIIGAGIAGLYTALILQDLGFDYEILEANPDRVGGRLYTHYFEESETEKHQYYDIGAMRFPDTPIMYRTFKLLREHTDTKLGQYIMTSDNEPMRYNDITCVKPKKGQPTSEDPFKVSTLNKGPVPLDTVMSADDILNDAYYPYRRKIKRAMNACIAHEQTRKGEPSDEWRAEEAKLLDSLERAWEYLMQHDKFSLRDYLAFVEGQDDQSIHWLETLNSATGWFDQAFSENVLESLAFEYTSEHDATDNPDPKKKGKDVDWFYIENGTYMLTMNVMEKLKKKPEMGKLVTAMTLVGEEGEQKKIAVTVRGEPQQREYDTVFNTTTFGALQKMDLTGLELPYAMKSAIRSLRYDTSTKVAIQFDKPWWIQQNHIPGGLDGIKGGLGKTDLPLRTCVYPSYNYKDYDADDPLTWRTVLLCSYTWGSDSERIASMVKPVSTKGSATAPGSEADGSPQGESADSEAPLKETMIDNLARLHSTSEEGYVAMKKLISKSYITHHAYDWSKDPYTCGGAFGLFSPAQFRSMYPSIVRPAADSRLHIIGEAASAHHAWIVGALDSSVRGLWLMLERFRLFDLQKKLVANWGDIGEVDKDTSHLQVALGMMGRTV
ncbi:hypothetical protein F5Y18DRAFT_393781 [Xylariaceae sp. FL1019]|nr:hypothetical protein F5Y18DRAFT_393781 [Xylariaceae sp. FL1019]